MRSLTRLALRALAVVAATWTLPPPGSADVYKYVDEDGIIHFTNVPPDARYRPVDEPARKKPRSKSKKPAVGKAEDGAKSGSYAKRSRVRPPSRKAETDEYDSFIDEASERFSIPSPLIRAVIAVESNFDPTAVSHAGAEGLMQLMPETAKLMGVEDTFDPRQNILGGTRFLRSLANTFAGDLVLTLAAYNAGQQRVAKAKDIPPIDETQIYVRRVLQLYYHYKKLYGPPTEDESP